MLRIVFAIALAALVASCQESDTQVLIGGTMIAYPGAAPVEDSIIVITGSTIKAAGLRKDIPVPQDSQRSDLQGKWILPAGAEHILAGQPANLLIYSRPPKSPGDQPDRRMINGKWQQ